MLMLMRHLANSVPSSAFIESSSRWGSDRDSGDDCCLEKVIDL